MTHVHDADRTLAFHRWVEGEGHDVIVVAHLATSHRLGYRLGFPGGGEWHEIFNSDVYEGWVNPGVAGNGGHVFAAPHPLDGFGHSAALVLPANSVLVFARWLGHQGISSVRRPDVPAIGRPWRRAA